MSSNLTPSAGESKKSRSSATRAVFSGAVDPQSDPYGIGNRTLAADVAIHMRRVLVVCLAALACTPTGIPSGDLPPDWSVHDAAGLRITVPTAWLGPEVLGGSPGGPTWVVFRDPSGAEAVSLMTWPDTTATAVAKTGYQTESHEVTLTEGSRTRPAIELTAYAGWSGAEGSGSYACRHLFVQIDATLVADVIACGAKVRGSSTPAPELRSTQDRVALRLGPSGR